MAVAAGSLKGKALVKGLKKAFGAKTNVELSKFIPWKTGRISQLDDGRKKVDVRTVVSLVKRSMQGTVNGQDLVNALMSKFQTASQSDLARKLGYAPARIASIKTHRTVPATQLANWIKRAHQVEQRRAPFRPVVEFFRVKRTKVRKKFELLDRTHPSPSQAESVEELKQAYGIYVFYDSRGKVLYIGKAERQKLWSEANAAYNRRRDTRLLLTSRPTQSHLESFKKIRIPMHELAYYFSAFEISPREHINDFEALLIRVAANDIFKQNIQKFSKRVRDMH
jgi:hypothetical protein